MRVAGENGGMTTVAHRREPAVPGPAILGPSHRREQNRGPKMVLTPLRDPLLQPQRTRQMTTGQRRWRMLYEGADEFPVPADLAEAADQAGLELVRLEGHEPASIVRLGATCDGMFLFRARVDDVVLSQLPRCRVLARVGTGYELIDAAAACKRGIVVTNVPGFSSEDLADHVMMLILAFARRMPLLLRAQSQHHWLKVSEFPLPHRLSSQSLGILGFGGSGSSTAKRARAFGMDVRVWTRTPRLEAVAAIGAHEASFRETLACDFVSLHVPLTRDTSRLIDAAALAEFRTGGILINVARGGLVDTDALVTALESGYLGGAGLDVVDPTPPDAQHALWRLPNVILTSHTASGSVEAFHEALQTAIADASAVLHGRTPRHPVPESRSLLQ